MAAQISFAPIDLFLILCYFIATFFFGVYRLRSGSDQHENFLIAGRQLSLAAFVATLVSTFYGGILGVGEFTYRYGLVSWFTQGFFYYLVEAAYAFLLAPKIRRNAQYTLPDQLYGHYNRATGLLGSFFTFILVTPAAYILMMATLLQVILGWKFLPAALVSTVFSTIYVLFGGLRSVVRTNIFQFLFMFLGFGLILPFAWHKLGSPLAILSHLPPGHTVLFGKLSLQQIIAWAFIALWTIVSPSFYQRCAAAKTEKVAQKGILISIGFWFLFDMMTLTAGLYARYALPNIDPVMSYPLLGQLVLPPVAKAIFFIGMLATIMSTLASLAFLSAVTLGRDFIWRLRDSATEKSHLTLYTRLGLLASIAIALGLAIGLKSVIEIWYTLGSLAIPILFLPLFTSFFPRLQLKAQSSFAMMLVTSIVAMTWFLLGYLHLNHGRPAYPLQIEPMYPSLLVSLLWWLIVKTGFSTKRLKQILFRGD